MKQRKGYTTPELLPGYSAGQFETELDKLIDSFSTSGFAGRYLKEEYKSRYLDETLVPARERALAAYQKWKAAEAKNAKTNTRLMFLDEDLGWVTTDRLVGWIRKFIAKILGPLEYPHILTHAYHSTGASTRVRRSPLAALDKVSGECHITEDAIKHYLAAWSGTMLSKELKIVGGNIAFTVPKKTEIDRAAAKEPEGNLILQRSVGIHIRDRLRLFGINLRDQGQNQRLAQQALARKLATVDLSSASDSITTQLVTLLLPFEWWSLLDDLRSKFTYIEGSWHENEMFSNMGNGFTFELESLIFFAIAKAVCYFNGCSGAVSVFGDDIILPSKTFPRFRDVMSLFGFTLNPKKTYHKGPFRESCGSHYWNGLSVKPFYLSKAVDTLPELINTLNHLLEWDGRGWGFFVTEEAYRFWEKWRQFVPKYLWGGIDPADPTCLVTGDFPRKRLVPRTRLMKSEDFNRYVFWHSVVSTLGSGREPFSVDPLREIGLKAVSVVSGGASTTWIPDLLVSTWAEG